MSSSGNQPVKVTLRRDLGLFDVTMIGVGAMIGTSIFVLIGVTIDEVGPAILLVFALNVIVTSFTAGVYAELGSTFPEAGGGYLWAKRALKHPGAFLTGWMTWFAHTVACSYYGLGFGYAIAAFSHSFEVDIFGLSDAMIVKCFAVVAILFFVYVNYSGVGATGKAGDLITIVQILIVSFFVAFMVMYAFDIKGIHMMDNFDPFFPEGTKTGKILMMMGFTFIAFEGYDIIVQCGEEVKNPKKNIPRAIFISVIVVAVLYLSVAFACLANPDVHWTWVGAEGENAVVSSARMVIPFVGAPIVILGSMLSAMAALNATVFSSSRVSFAMGRDRSLPRIFGSLHKTKKIPHNAILITAMIMLFMALFFPLSTVVAATSIMFLLLFSIANVASIRLRSRLTQIDIGFKTPLFPLFPVVGIISTIGIAVYLFWFIPEAWYIALVWIGIGLAVSAFVKPETDFVSIADSKRVPQQPLPKEQAQRYRVFLALENVGDLRLLSFAGILARYFKGELTVNKIVEVPRAMPLEAIGKDYVQELAEGLQKAVKVTPSTVNVRPAVSVSYDVAGAILDQTRHEAANLLVLGWKGTRRRGRTILGRNLDVMVRRASCDIAIIKTKRMSKNPEKILLVSGKFFETRKALLLALPIAKEYNAGIEILAVVTDDKQLELVKGNASRLKKICDRVHVPAEIRLVRSKSVVNSVMEHAQGVDLLVMGAGPQRALERTLFGAVYDRIIRTVDVPVLVLRTSKTEKASFIPSLPAVKSPSQPSRPK
jgi:amino acid transporter/nucleotide-binding universal stress UspA family protein